MAGSRCMSASPPPPEPPNDPPASETDTALERLRNARAAKREARGGDKPADRKRSAIGLGSVLVVIVLAAGAWFVVQKVLEMGKIQDCVMQGRKNCDHLDDPNGR
jgi:hypothetical protein